MDSFEEWKDRIEDHFGCFFLGLGEGFADGNNPDEGNDPDEIIIVMLDEGGVTLCAPSWLLGESKERARRYINRPTQPKRARVRKADGTS